MATDVPIAELVATIGGKKYRLVPSASCKGCAFEHKCYAVGRELECPVFNDYTLASDIDVIYKDTPDTPPKNWEVGTAEEIANRFIAYCKMLSSPDASCNECELGYGGRDVLRCLCRWAQMPYTENKVATQEA